MRSAVGGPTTEEETPFGLPLVEMVAYTFVCLIGVDICNIYNTDVEIREKKTSTSIADVEFTIRVFPYQRLTEMNFRSGPHWTHWLH